MTTIQDALNDRLDEIEQRFATLASTARSQNWVDKKEVRSQLSSRSGAAFAEIEHVQTVLTAADAALASDILTVSAEVGDVAAEVELNATAIATLNSAFSSYSTTTTATLGALTSSVTTNSAAIATLDGYAAARYSITLDVNGYASGFELINGGAGISAATFLVDKFQIASPGVSGGTPVPIFTVGNVSGSPKIAIRGDMFIDGTITASMIAAGAITAVKIAAGTITANEIAAGAITAIKIAAGAITAEKIAAGSITTNEIAVGGVDLLNIIANAVTQQSTASAAATGAGNHGTLVSHSMLIKSGTASCMFSASFDANMSMADSVSINLFVDGVLQKTWKWSANNGTGFQTFSTPFTLFWDVTGLTNAIHTVSWTKGGSAVFSTTEGMSRIQDLRR